MESIHVGENGGKGNIILIGEVALEHLHSFRSLSGKDKVEANARSDKNSMIHLLSKWRSHSLPLNTLCFLWTAAPNDDG